ncbi:MAG: dTDP-4-amino-4,6-dideoxygalactose transaminase, partial [Thermoproteota archaeon]
KILSRFEEIVLTNGFVEGKYNSLFEEEFAKMCEAKHSMLVANGTDALEIALQAYGVKAGDKVGVPAISFYASAECIVSAGAEVIFIDVDYETGLIDPKSLERILEKHDLKAIIPVHIYGQTAPIEELEAICDPKGIKIIEDAAQAQGGFYTNGKPVGSSKNLCTFSFYPTKNLAAFGDAGGITTQDDQLMEDIKSIRNHGRSPEGHRLIGRNSRCDHLQAAVLHMKLEEIEKFNEQRKEAAALYLEALSGLSLRIPKEEFLKTSSWHLFPIGLSNREEKYKLQEFLKTKEIGSALFYEKAMPEEKPIAHCEGEKEVALEFAANTLCLPMHPFLTKKDIDSVASAISEFFTK